MEEKSAAEVAMIIKLGEEEIDIAEFGYTITDMIPYFDHEVDDVADAFNGHPIKATILTEYVKFKWNGLNFDNRDLMKTEEDNASPILRSE